MKTVRILVVFANPPGTEPLFFDKELSVLNGARAGCQQPARFDVRNLPAAHKEAVWNEIGQYRPHIVHFICHGNKDGELLLYSKDLSDSAPLGSDYLSGIVHTHQEAQRTAEDKIRLVVMTGCWTAYAAGKLAQHVDIALGFNDAVQATAIVDAFAYRLYTKLFNGDSVSSAVDAAREAMVERFPADAQMLRVVVRSGVEAKSYILFAESPVAEEPITLDVLLRSARELQSKKRERDVLDRRVAEDKHEMAKSGSEAERKELEAKINQCELDLLQLDADIDALQAQVIYDAAREGAGGPMRSSLTRSWQDNCHRIDYDSTLKPIGSLLDEFYESGSGGAAFFVVPQQNKMGGEWLLKRVKEWTEQDRHHEYRVRHLVLDMLDVNFVLGELCKQFNVKIKQRVGDSAEEPVGDPMPLLAERVVKSGAGEHVVLALELRIKLTKASATSLFDFLRWLLEEVWTALKAERIAQKAQCRSLRLLMFVMTDLDLQNPPAGLFVDVPKADCDCCILTSVPGWEVSDVCEWLRKYSRLADLGSDPKKVKERGEYAYDQGEGFPRRVWSQLLTEMNEELDARLES